MQVKDSSPPKAVVAGIGVMVAEAPFVGWYHVNYLLQGSPAEGFYYVYTAALVTTVATTASNQRCNRVAYKDHRSLRRG